MANEIENATTGTTQAEEANWKTRIYVSGTVLGGFLGLLSAYLFAVLLKKTKISNHLKLLLAHSLACF
jgi:hypothetical protein